MEEQTFNETLEPAVQAVTDIANNKEVMNYAEELMKSSYSEGLHFGMLSGTVIGATAAFGVTLLIYKLTHKKKKETEVTETNEE